MRITQSILQRTALGSMQSSQRQIAVAQQKVATGLRVQKASDDPVAAAGAMQADGSLRALDQYRRNIQSAQSRTHVEESALDSLQTLLVRAKELALGQGSDTASAATRAVTRQEVDRILEEAMQLGNTRFAGTYLFGGNQAGEAPITRAPGEAPVVRDDIDPDYRHQTEIGAGQRFFVNHNARTVFGSEETSPLAALHRLSEALGQDAEAVRGSIDGLDAAFTHVQTLVGDVGARSNHLGVAEANLHALDTNLRIVRSDLVEVDLEAAITELVGRQTAYQAAMLATSRVMGMTLMDYLR